MTTNALDVREARPPAKRGDYRKTKHQPDLAWYVRSQSLEGTELIQFLLRVMRDGDEQTTLRLQAAGMLLDRGFGKAAQVIDINVQETKLSATFTLEELKALRDAIQAGQQPLAIESTLAIAEADSQQDASE